MTLGKIAATVAVVGSFSALVWWNVPTNENNEILDLAPDQAVVEAEYIYEEPLTYKEAVQENIQDPYADDTVEISRPFDEAFADSREELGPDGLFEWEGREYTCLYKEELEDLIIKAIEDSISTHNSSIQIVETVLPVEVIEDSTLIQSEAKFEDFTP